MTDEISWVLMLSVKEGQLEAFRVLMNEMVQATQSDHGTTVYEWFVSEEESSVHIYERYTDSDVLLVHLGEFGENFADRFFACVDPTGWYVFGNPSDAAVEALTSSGAQILSPFGGFAR